MSIRFATSKALSFASPFLRERGLSCGLYSSNVATTVDWDQRKQFSSGPSLERARAMRPKLCDMENIPLTLLAHQGDHKAGIEVLKRHIMSVDNVSYEDACVTFAKIKCETGGFDINTLPYHVGISGGLFAAFASFPMVFNLDVACWFNEKYVTTDVPKPVDLETFLEVGIWSWEWIGPPIGVMSFVLLCLQLSR